MDVTTLVTFLASKYPVVMAILSVMGVLRLFLKPAFSILHSLFTFAKLKSCDDELTAVETSKFMQGFYYILDWVASVKVGTQAPKP